MRDRHDVPPGPIRSILRPSIALAATACVTVEAALVPPGVAHTATFALGVVVAILAALLAARTIRLHRPDLGGCPRSLSVWVAATVSGALAIELAARTAAGSPPLLDVVFLAILRDTVVALALVSHHARAAGLCAGLSAFLALAGSAEAIDVPFQGFVASCAAVGVWWLMGSHRDAIGGRTIAGRSEALPRRWMAAMPCLVLCVPILTPLPTLAARALEGCMPASGGQRDASPSARDGVGDGDALVKGLNDIRSFAPIDDAPFLNSHEPSLYDMFDDRYNEPVTATTERAVALPFQPVPSDAEPELAQSHRAGREFSTVRRAGEPSAARIADLDSAAIFHLQGRVPLHLRLETYDRYDGVHWEPEPAPERMPRVTMSVVRGRPWLRLPFSPSEEGRHAHPEQHALKVVALGGDRVPLPNRPTGIHVAHVEREDFYRWEQPGVVALDRETIPGQLVIHLQSCVVDRRHLAREPAAFAAGRDDYRRVGGGAASDAVRALAESWVAGLPRGLPQVDRICAGLREGYVLDESARVRGDGGHTVAEFLLGTGRGPDYLFASAAVTMLRSLGYGARLVSGFYADARRHDPRSGHTPVTADDVHFWAEVAIGPDAWLTVEPTPGYAVLGPPLAWSERLVEAARALVLAAARHPGFVLLAIASIVLAWRWRARLCDLADTAWWMASGSGSSREAVLATVALLDRRCRRAGLTRPRDVTPTRWLAAVGRHLERVAPMDRHADVDRFLGIADEALYAPCFEAGPTIGPRLAAARFWSLRNLVTVPVPTPGRIVRPPRGDLA